MKKIRFAGIVLLLATVLFVGCDQLAGVINPGGQSVNGNGNEVDKEKDPEGSENGSILKADVSKKDFGAILEWSETEKEFFAAEEITFETLPKKGDELEVTVEFLLSSSDVESVKGYFSILDEKENVSKTEPVLLDISKTADGTACTATGKIKGVASDNAASVALNIRVKITGDTKGTSFVAVESGKGLQSVGKYFSVETDPKGIKVILADNLIEEYEISVLVKDVPLYLFVPEDEYKAGKREFLFPFVEKDKTYYLTFRCNLSEDGGATYSYKEELLKCTAGGGTDYKSYIDTDALGRSKMDVKYHADEKLFNGTLTLDSTDIIKNKDAFNKAEISFSFVLGYVKWIPKAEWWATSGDTVNLLGTYDKVTEYASYKLLQKILNAEWALWDNCYASYAEILLDFKEYPDAHFMAYEIWSEQGIYESNTLKPDEKPKVYVFQYEECINMPGFPGEKMSVTWSEGLTSEELGFIVKYGDTIDLSEYQPCLDDSHPFLYWRNCSGYPDIIQSPFIVNENSIDDVSGEGYMCNGEPIEFIIVLEPEFCDGNDPALEPEPEPEPPVKDVKEIACINFDGTDWLQLPYIPFGDGADVEIVKGEGVDGSDCIKVTQNEEWGELTFELTDAYSKGKSYYIEAMIKDAGTPKDVNDGNRKAMLSVTVVDKDIVDICKAAGKEWFAWENDDYEQPGPWGTSVSDIFYGYENYEKALESFMEKDEYGDLQYPQPNHVTVSDSTWTKVGGIISADTISYIVDAKNSDDLERLLVVLLLGSWPDQSGYVYYVDNLRIVDLNPDISVGDGVYVSEPSFKYNETNSFDIQIDEGGTYPVYLGGGLAAGCTFTCTGELPPGITLSKNGIFIGTISADSVTKEQYIVKVTGKNSVGSSQIDVTFNITVGAGEQEITE